MADGGDDETYDVSQPVQVLTGSVGKTDWRRPESKFVPSQKKKICESEVNDFLAYKILESQLTYNDDNG